MRARRLFVAVLQFYTGSTPLLSLLKIAESAKLGALVCRVCCQSFKQAPERAPEAWIQAGRQL
ncbi:MAG: hypothetical protein KME46_26020 [Brasilonema angustatum HA4187-MV1]|jgi:hypothetical protein|nr:hypothetical protein [Brasilonema angustatum HA4187-MV1]